MGHDFLKDKVWGKLLNLGPFREIPMCLIPLFLFPTTLIEELLLVVEAVNDFGGWCGRTVSPHPHTHSTHNFGCSSPHADIHLHSTSCWTPTNCKIASFLLCVHPRTKTELFFLTQGLHCPLFSLLGRIVYPRTGILLFGVHIVSWEPCSCIHDWLWRAIHVFGCLTD